MNKDLKEIYREFLNWDSVAVEFKITSKGLHLVTLDRVHIDSGLPLEKLKSWFVVVKVPL